MRQIFISYSHASDRQKQDVHALVDRLRGEGLSVILDRDKLPGGPEEGWPAWSQAQVIKCDCVLLACDEAYGRRYEMNESPGVGLGTVCEARTVRQLLYDAGGINPRFRVVLFDDTQSAHVPVDLRPYHQFRVHRPGEYESLVSWLRGPADQAATPGGMRWPDPHPSYVWPLADRKPEFGLFQKMVTGRAPQRILVLKGETSAGKTVLRSELAAYARALQLACAVVDFKGCPSMEEVFQALRVDLGAGILREALVASGPSRFFHLISDLQKVTTPVVVIFDTWEQGPVEAQDWVQTQLLPRLDRAPGVIAIIGGQVVPDHAGQSWRSLTERRQLQPISQATDWIEYVNRRWNTQIEPKYIEGLLMATHGDPGKLSPLLDAMMATLQENAGT